MARAYETVEDGGEDEALADLAQGRANIAFFKGNLDEALALADTALRIADGRRLGAVLVSALTTKANVLAEVGRPAESTALLTHAVKLGVAEDLGGEAV